MIVLISRAIAARLRLVADSPALRPLRALVRKLPLARRVFRSLGTVRRQSVTQERTWVRVQRGFAKGVELYLDTAWEDHYWLGRHEPEVQNVLDRLVRPGAVVYDVGAHIGFLSLAIARRVGPEGVVCAFEADPENAARLRQAAERNALGERIRLTEAAVWSEPGELVFARAGRDRTQGGAVGTHAPPHADAERITVSAITLDEAVASGLPLPDLIKIDVEGGEWEVLRGGVRLWAAASPALICEIHHQELAEPILRWLSENGREWRWLEVGDVFPRTLVAEAAPTAPPAGRTA